MCYLPNYISYHLTYHNSTYINIISYRIMSLNIMLCITSYIIIYHSIVYHNSSYHYIIWYCKLIYQIANHVISNHATLLLIVYQIQYQSIPWYIVYCNLRCSNSIMYDCITINIQTLYEDSASGSLVALHYQIQLRSMYVVKSNIPDWKMPAAKEDCSYKRCQRGPQQTRINEVYVQKIQRIAVRCSGLHRLGQSSQATQHSMTSHVRPSWDLKLPLLHFIRQGHSLWAPLLKRFGTWNMPTRQQKKLGEAAVLTDLHRTAERALKNQNNLLTVWTTLQQKLLHGILMDVPWCRWPSLNATENRRWDFPSCHLSQHKLFRQWLGDSLHTGHLRHLQSPDSAELPQLNMNLQCTGCSFRSSLPRSTCEFY